MNHTIAICTGYLVLFEGIHRAFLDAGHRIPLVITRDGAQDIVDRCQDLEIEVCALPVRPGEMSIAKAMAKDPAYAAEVRAAVEAISRIEIDYLITWGMHVLPEVVTELATRMAVNLHPSALPHYRGGFPFQAQILNGETSMSVTVHETVRKIDAGGILGRSEPIDILEDDTMSTLVERCVEVGSRLLLDTLGPGPSKDDSSARESCPLDSDRQAWGVKLRRDDSGNRVNTGVLGRLRIEWDLDTCEEVCRTVRAFDMMGGPYTNLGSEIVRIQSATPGNGPADGRPGEILAVENGSVRVRAKDGPVDLSVVTTPEIQDKIRIGALFTSTVPIAAYSGIPNSDRVPVEVGHG